jgi:hypothetical protein
MTITDLTGNLEGHPLIDEVGLCASSRERELVVLIVAIDEVTDNRGRFPESEVIVVVVNDSRNTCRQTSRLASSL